MFTILAFLLAYLIAALGLFRIFIGFSFAGTPEAADRYLGTATTGEAIDGGIYYVLIAVGLGVAAEISRSLKKLAAVEYE